MTEETRMALLLMGELVADWMTPLLTQEDAYRLVGWHSGVNF